MNNGAGYLVALACALLLLVQLLTGHHLSTETQAVALVGWSLASLILFLRRGR